MKGKLPTLPPPGEINIGVVVDGRLHMGGGFVYETPLKPGKYIVTSFGCDSLLLTECTSESSQLLSEASRGICLSGGPFHIQAHILRPSRTRPRNHTEKRSSTPPNMSRMESRVLPESRQPHRQGKGCSSFPSSRPTTSRCKPSARTGRRNSNTHNVFLKFAHAWIQDITKPQNTQEARHDPR